jgi:hypothetical protein
MGWPSPCPTACDESVWLRWNFEVGKPFYVVMNTKTSQDITVMGQKVSEAADVTYYFSFTPLEYYENGDWLIRQKIEGLKTETETGGPNPLSEALVGSEFTLALDTKMNIIEIDGQNEFLDDFKEMSQYVFRMVPNKAVKKGESWTKTAILSMGPTGTFESNYKYTYEGSDESKLQKIKVDTTLKYNPPGPKAGGTLPFKIVKADLNSKESNGNILFDATKGRVSSCDMTMHLTGTLTIEIGGMTGESIVDLTQTTKVKITDENPHKQQPRSTR